MTEAEHAAYHQFIASIPRPAANNILDACERGEMSITWLAFRAGYAAAQKELNP